MKKFTTTGIYIGFSLDAKIQRIISTMSFEAYPRAKYDERSMVRDAARKLVVIDIVLNIMLGVFSSHKMK